MRRSNGILWGTNHILHEDTPSDSGLLITILGQRPYLETLSQMQAYTANRRPNDPDQNGLTMSISPETAGWKYVGFEVYHLSPGQTLEKPTGAMEVCLVMLLSLIHI